jgi:hypothetical protein
MLLQIDYSEHREFSQVIVCIVLSLDNINIFTMNRVLLPDRLGHLKVGESEATFPV